MFCSSKINIHISIIVRKFRMIIACSTNVIITKKMNKFV